MEFSIAPIAYIKTPFSQKFAIPRQGLSLSIAKGKITFEEHINSEHALSGINDFSHLWVFFLFHENIDKGFKDKIRPPRLGGNKKVGVFASRSSFRPNHIGMTLVENLGVKDGCLLVGGVDMMDNTPIIDIKPYLAYADVAPDAKSAYAADAPKNVLQVSFAESVLSDINICEQQHPDFSALLSSVLAQDPRPAYKKNGIDNKQYAISLYGIDIAWKVEKDQAIVTNVRFGV